MNTTRRNLIAGLTGAAVTPAFAKAEQTPEGDVITQAELETFRQLHLKLDLMHYSFQWRLWGGATVEPGPHSAQWDEYGQQPEPFEPSCGVHDGHACVSFGPQGRRS